MTEENEKAKRQAYSFNFPPDKKEKFAALARSMNRPMAWLLLEAIDRMIESGGTYPSNTSTHTQSVNVDVLSEYVSKADLPLALVEYTSSFITGAEAQVLIDDAIALIRNNTPSVSSTKTASPDELPKHLALVVGQLNREVPLKERVAEGVAQGLNSREMAKWLADGGFLAKGGAVYSQSSAARLATACKHIDGGEVDG
jgi:hypothetical protein